MKHIKNHLSLLLFILCLFTGTLNAQSAGQHQLNQFNGLSFDARYFTLGNDTLLGKNTNGDIEGVAISSFLTPSSAAATYQPKDNTLTALAGATTGPDVLSYWSDNDTLSSTTLTVFGRSIIAATDEPALQTILGLNSGTAFLWVNNIDVTSVVSGSLRSGGGAYGAGAISLYGPSGSFKHTITSGAASSNKSLGEPNKSGYHPIVVDTGGVVSLAGGEVKDTLPVSKGGLGVALVDPNADKLIFWDDSAGQHVYLTLGTGLSITGTTINAAGGASTWLIKTANYTAVSGDNIQANTAGGSFTIALPAAPADGDPVVIEDASFSWGASPLTIARNGLKINGGTSDFTANVPSGKLTCVYISAAYGWSIK